jgi:hypothetical protein
LFDGFFCEMVDGASVSAVDTVVLVFIANPAVRVLGGDDALDGGFG